MRVVVVGLVAVIVLGGGIAKADFTFGEPTNLGPPLSNTFQDEGPCITADELEFYLSRGGRLYLATRATTDDDWSTPVNLGNRINIGADNFAPCVSVDGLQLYFTSNATHGYGSYDLWATTRDEIQNEWSTPMNVGYPVSDSTPEWCPVICTNGLELYFSSYRRSGGYGGWDVWVATRETTDDNWHTPVNLGPSINSSANEGPGSISANGLTLFLHSNRGGGNGGYDIWMTRRATINDTWGEPVNLGPNVNSPTHDMFPTISFDGHWLYFSDFLDSDLQVNNRPGGFGLADIWKVSIDPVVDLNADGIVDSVDMCIMVDHWGENNSLCDIGPTPFGDGVVDVEDLIILADHLFEDHRLIAHWKLDETEGDIAYDSAKTNDVVVLGNPLWQPEGGIVDGAIFFDGINDYISTDFLLNPANGFFSLFAWVKGGEPGQVIVSQQSMANWLAVDAEGNLMTELKCTGRSAGPLYSETVITDGQWHRIGLVWDASHRTLYVDSVAVAEDTQHGLVDSQMGLYIGTGKGIEIETFWSGLIDDVRIYNQALTAEEIAALAQ